MYTFCPHCDTLYRINASQLTAAQGQVRCGVCHNIFNALDTLGEEAGQTRESATRQARERHATDSAGDIRAEIANTGEAPAELIPEEIAADIPAPIESAGEPESVSDDTLHKGKTVGKAHKTAKPAGHVTWKEIIPKHDAGNVGNGEIEATARGASQAVTPEPGKDSAPDQFHDSGIDISSPAFNELSEDIKAIEQLAGLRNEPIDAQTPNVAQPADEKEQTREREKLEPPPSAELFQPIDSGLRREPFIAEKALLLNNDDSGGQMSARTAADEKPRGAKTPDRKPRAAPDAEPRASEDKSRGAAAMPPAAQPRGRGTTVAWSLMNLLLIVMLAGQYVYFQHHELAKYPQLRSWLARFCDVAGCEIPLMRDAAQITLMNRLVRSHPARADALLINATLVNEAPFPQSYPIVELRFSDLNGRVIAGRRFAPGEYLEPKENIKQGMAPRKPVNLNLEIVDPGKDAVSFEFNLL